jgi:Actin interacting protein 3
MSQIEKSVTHLLVATKQLLETLTQWSRGQAQEEEVSDVYVRLGYEFNLACRAFNSIGVETSDLGPVPDLLRSILEDTLSQPASPQSLDNFLPRIRDIIINLLHGLKRKQAKLRSRPGKENASKGQGPARQASGASLGSNETGLTQMLEDVPSQHQKNRQFESRTGGSDLHDEANGVPSRATSNGGPTASPNRHSLQRDVHRSIAQSNSGSSLSSNAAQNLPVLPPYSEPEQTGPRQLHELNPSPSLPRPPAPPPKQLDAFAALQRGGDLERRASRRFSNYQISKHLGASPHGIPLIPPAQNSPVPNRGRDDRESMTAVQSRRSTHHSRQRFNNRFVDSSPSRGGTVKPPEPISEESPDSPESLRQTPRLVAPTEPTGNDSPTVKTPDDMYPRMDNLSPDEKPVITATLSGPLASPPAPQISPVLAEEAKPVTPDRQRMPVLEAADSPRSSEAKVEAAAPPASQQFIPEESPPPGKELTLFLQYKSKIKKFMLPDGYEELTIARLQLAFIEKFAWNTHNNGVDLPEIYIQDPVSGVRHELEDLSDVKDRSVLVLNVEVLDEVKRHFDDGIGGLRKMLESVSVSLDGQGSMMERFSNRQLETSKEMARISAVPRQAIPNASRMQSSRSTPAASAASVSEVQSLRRDIAVLRQTYDNMSAEFTASMTAIKQKGANVKSVAADAVVPTFEGNAGRAHVNNGKKALLQDSEALVNRVDDLSDLVEDLRKDVVTRGVRPRPRQLEDVSKNISTTVKELAKMKEFLKREKPIWTKIWEKELDLVCQERDELTQQEDLMADLHGDLEDLSGVFRLVEEATKQQNLQNGAPSGLRSTSRSLPIDPDIDPQRAKDGVLGEVRALQPNHENRLEAIERAEKARQRELESRKGGEFQREVEKFVEEGKLKKTGGAEEAERLRKAKDEKARKENWERAQQRQAELEARQPEENAAAAAAAEQADGKGDPTADAEAYAEAQERPDETFHNAQTQGDTSVEADRNQAMTAESPSKQQDHHEQNTGTSFLDLHTE